MKLAAGFDPTFTGKVKNKRPKSVFRQGAETLISAIAIAAFIVLFVARAFTVQGPSMLPTLHTGERILVDQVSYRFREPVRGEIIVFRYPADPRQYYVKRVIGLPGDRVQMKDGQLSVNGVALEETYIPAHYSARDFGPVTVPEDGADSGFFVLGDHRNNSEDSRMASVGFVPKESIVGRALWRFWPLDGLAVLDAPSSFKAVAAAAPNGEGLP